MNIKRRIWSLPLISTLLFGLGLGISSYFATSALNSIRTTGDVDYPVLSQSAALVADVQSIADDLKNAVVEGDKKRLETVDERAAKTRDKLKVFAAIPGHKTDAERVAVEFDSYYAPARSAARLMLGVDEGDPQSAIEKMQSTLKVLSADLDTIHRSAQTQFTDGIASSAEGVRFVLIASVLVALVVVLVLVAVSFFVVRDIWSQLGGEPEYARTIAQAVAAGDLSIAIDTDPDNSGSVLAALSEMKTRLAGIVAGIQNSSEEIKVASREIANGNADLSSRTEAQAHNLGAAAQSLKELTDTVQKNAESSRHANALADTASGVATKGGQVVSQVVDTMGDISFAAKKIADITSVIDGIAFQTNILALNAAVEAARAGEQGRGFAVVASEVRSLAQRSANAAKEIKGLIENSVHKVSIGASLVEEAGRTMDEIVTSVQHVNNLIGEITAASQEQSVGLGQLSHSFSEMDESTQQNAAMTEQAAAAARSLQEQAMQLGQAVGVFKLSAAPAPALPSRPPLLAVAR